jgi:hypothetical protein
MTKAQYDELFRYQSQAEGRSMALVEETVYLMRDGKRTFLKDIDEGAFRELVRSLDEATAWNAPQMDAARMIQSELQGRSANGGDSLRGVYGLSGKRSRVLRRIANPLGLSAFSHAL